MLYENNLKVVESLAIQLHDFYMEPFPEGLNAEGVYAFWWKGPIDKLKELNRQISFKGKQVSKSDIKSGKYTPDLKHVTHDIEWDWNLNRSPVCIYVGKSVNIKSRIKLHLAESLQSENWYLNGAEEKWHIDSKYLAKRTTSCQLRAGIEHLFKGQKPEPIKERLKNFAFSFVPLPDVKQRFYVEDLAIGYYSPWFNLDCER